MKKRILCLILALIMLVGMCAVFTSCDDECTEHVDENNDKKCDKCGADAKGLHKHKDEDKDEKCDGCGKSMTGGEGGEEEVVVYPWADDEPVQLIFQLTNNSNQKELPSGCSRYLAGGADDPQYTPFDQDIDAMVLERNTKALEATNVAVRYQYYDDTLSYGRGECIEIMYSNAVSGAVGSIPDMYCNFTYDIVAASIKGAFSNLRSTLHNYEGANYFSFLDEDYNETVDNEGYMYDYMCSTTLNYDKMYLLASDYFTDMIRAFFIVPVNKTLLESVGMQVTGDKDGDGVFTIEDFYAEVKEKKWNYAKVADYSAAIYTPGAANTGSEHIEDILGFAISAHGLAASGLLYSNDISIINKTYNTSTGKYDYSYPEESPQLVELFKNAKTLVESKGVFCVTGDGPDEKKYGSKQNLVIRKRFCDSKILFGDIMLVGALEYDEYQRLKDSDGFGVVPVPLNSANYNTEIHNIGRSGAIAANTAKFAECTAFLDYQSTHSADILNEYYVYNLQYGVTKGYTDTVEMLQYIRLNVGSGFDKIFEDALSFRFADIHEQEGLGSTYWYGKLSGSGYLYGAQIEDYYDSLRNMKQEELMTRVRDYDTNPS